MSEIDAFTYHFRAFVGTEAHSIDRLRRGKRDSDDCDLRASAGFRTYFRLLDQERVEQAVGAIEETGAFGFGKTEQPLVPDAQVGRACEVNQKRDANRILRGQDLTKSAEKCRELKAFLNTILLLCGGQPL